MSSASLEFSSDKARGQLHCSRISLPSQTQRTQILSQQEYDVEAESTISQLRSALLDWVEADKLCNKNLSSLKESHLYIELKKARLAVKRARNQFANLIATQMALYPNEVSFKHLFLQLQDVFEEPIECDNVSGHPWYQKVYETLRYQKKKHVFSQGPLEVIAQEPTTGRVDDNDCEVMTDDDFVPGTFERSTHKRSVPISKEYSQHNDTQREEIEGQDSSDQNDFNCARIPNNIHVTSESGVAFDEIMEYVEEFIGCCSATDLSLMTFSNIISELKELFQTSDHVTVITTKRAEIRQKVGSLTDSRLLEMQCLALEVPMGEEKSLLPGATYTTSYCKIIDKCIASTERIQALEKAVAELESRLTRSNSIAQNDSDDEDLMRKLAMEIDM